MFNEICSDQTGFYSFSGWCLKNEGVSCVLLGASTVDQLKEDIASLKVTFQLRNSCSPPYPPILKKCPTIIR